MFRDAYQSLQRNLAPLFAYIGITTAYYTVKLAGETYFIDNYEVDTLTGLPQSYLFVSGLVTAGIYAAAQTYAFSKLGQDLDRPFWKIASTKEAFAKFFGLWLLLDLANITFLVFTAVMPIDDSAKASLQLFWLLWAAFYLPLGATIMFYGNIKSEELREAFATIGHQFPAYLILTLFAFCVITLVLALDATSIPIWSKPGLAIVDGYVDCFLFACTWHICRAHRTYQEENHDDFDF